MLKFNGTRHGPILFYEEFHKPILSGWHRQAVESGRDSYAQGVD